MYAAPRLAVRPNICRYCKCAIYWSRIEGEWLHNDTELIGCRESDD